MMNKKFYVLVGPPSIGKSTWIENNFHASPRPYVINRDQIVEEIASRNGWTYDEMFVYPPEGSGIGDKDEKYGDVIDSPTYMTWQRLSYSGILNANNLVQTQCDRRFLEASDHETVVVDMTNLNKESRGRAFNAIRGREQIYEKIAVVFEFRGIEPLILAISKKRALDAIRNGGSKSIPPESLNRMLDSYQEVTFDEGFDQIITIDNRSLLAKLLNGTSLKRDIKLPRL